VGGNGSGRRPTGKSDPKAYGRAWRVANPDKRRAYNLKQFGLTVEQYDEMLRRQGGVCAVCGRPPKVRRLNVDHDHATDRVRCLACHLCNRNRIGMNTATTARKVLELLTSDFDGRNLGK
jgi:hypothetical protein